jgi:hypothetical protein
VVTGSSAEVLLATACTKAGVTAAQGRHHAAGRPLRSSLAVLVPCRVASLGPGLPEATLLWLLAHQEATLARTCLDLPYDGQGSVVWENRMDTQDVPDGEVAPGAA